MNSGESFFARALARFGWRLVRRGERAADSRRALLELTAIMENAPIGIVLSRERRITGYNRKFRDMFGFDGDSGIGQPGRVVYRSDAEYDALGRAAGPLLSSAQPFATEMFMRRQDGSDLWVSLIGYVQNQDNPREGTVWLIEDHSELHQTSRELDALMRNAPVGLIFTRNRKIVRYNAKLATLFGFDGEQGVGMPARVLYCSDDEYDALGRVATPLLSQGLPFQTELFMRRQDGSDFWVHLIGYVQNTEDPGEGTIWICEDRSAFKQARESLEQANAELVVARDRAEVANRAKSEFLAKMSHELRTPLNAVLGYAQILKREPAVTERAALGLNTIEQSGKHLMTLINDILDLSRIEAGRLELDPGVVYLPSFLRVVADIIRVKAEQKDLLFVYEAPDGLPRAVHADGKRLRQVLLNLLGNAVKFTDSGQVTLQVGLQPGADASRTRLVFEIADTGIGIAPQQSPRLFQPFEQVGEMSRREGGTGLGLAISRELVRAMGGDIAVRSTPGVGSVFSFEIEVPLVDAEPARSRERMASGYRGPRKKVLVVDDIAESRTLVADFLRSLGFATSEAADGRAALAEAQDKPPDLVVMDSVMPVMGGVEATRRLRELPALRATPIIAISASATPEDRSRSLAAGSNAFVLKPIDFSELLSRIESLLQLSWTYLDEDEAAAGSGAAAAAMSAPPAHEMRELHRLAMVGNMREIRRRAAQLGSTDARYAGFASELDRLAQDYQSNAIRRFVERHMNS